MAKIAESTIEQIRVYNTAYTTMMNFAQGNLNREVLGIFFGHLEDKSIIVTNAHPFRVGGKQEVQFTDEDYEKALPLIQNANKKGLLWLGWFHSHPFNNGDHLYMSKTDKNYHYPAQIQNSYWTAIIINPFQINDLRTTKGMRAFQLIWDPNSSKLTKTVKILNISIIHN